MTDILKSAPFRIDVTLAPDGEPAQGVNLYVDGDLFASSGAAPVVSFTFPLGLQVSKTYTITAKAFNDGGESPEIILALIVNAPAPNQPIAIYVVQ